MATSLAVIVVNSAAGFAAHLGEAHLDPGPTLAFAAAIIGSLLAGRLAHRIPTPKLQRWFAYLVFVTAAFVLAEVALAAPIG